MAIILPPIISLLFISYMPFNEEILLHWNAQGQIDRYGFPWEFIVYSFIMSGCNVLLAVCYLFSNKLYSIGLVHGVSQKATRPYIVVVAIVIVLVWFGITLFAYYKINA